MSTRALRLSSVLVAVVAWGCGDSPTRPGPVLSPSSQTVVAPAQPTPEPFNPTLAGEYTLTITASDSCVLPPEARQRRYAALATEPARGAVIVELSGADFAAWGHGGGPHSLEGTRDFETLIFRRVEIGERMTGEPTGLSEITTVQLQVPPRISGPYEGSHDTSLPSCIPA